MTALGLPEAEETTSPRIGVLRVLVGLLVVAVSTAAVWIVIAWGISTLGSDAPTIEEVEAYTQVELPDGASVASGLLESDGGFTIFTAEVRLPEGAGNPLDDSTYTSTGAEVPGWASDLPERLDDLEFFSAQIEGEGNVVAAATGTESGGGDILVFFIRLAE